MFCAPMENHQPMTKIIIATSAALVALAAPAEAYTRGSVMEQHIYCPADSPLSGYRLRTHDIKWCYVGPTASTYGKKKPPRR
jgi:hypothetical protein